MIKNLNGIRGILFLLIFITHFKYIIKDSTIGQILFPYLNNGGFAVLFFFVLSGFVTAIGYSDKFYTVTKENYGNYLLKRIIKFYPLYFITGLILLIFLNIPRNINWIYHFIFLYAPMITPWTKYTDYGGNSVGWFLATIFYSYLLTPFILVLFNRVKTLKTHITLGVLVYSIMFSICIVCLLLHYGNSTYLYTSPIVALLQYILGVDLGLIYKKYCSENVNNLFNGSCIKKSFIDIVVVSIVLFFMLCFQQKVYAACRDIVYIPIILAFTLYLCNNTKSLLSCILNSKIVLFLAGISFEGYLIHNVVMEFTKPYCVGLIYTPKVIICLFAVLFTMTICFSVLYKKLQSIFVK